MNGRILELVGRAKFMAEETINKQISKNAELDAFAEKFAELIVRECAKVARSQTLEKYPGMKSDYDGIVYVEEAIKSHFGVEE